MKGRASLSQPGGKVALAELDVSVRGTAAVEDPRRQHKPPAVMERLLRRCRVRNQLVRECMAECLGVYIMIDFDPNAATETCGS
ncbi:unnamed protein product [Merluccius merluccius]